ncbi:abasic site processing protein HMCES [Pieris brassicae]|uniref:Abasic site processing protein HMCES n=1 Tax=Pieris brassicae TaxID=7116 RepID=A0A9P0TSU9_PIEBR|nr:abasic site processing protein HMCES [Pieris brassicae]CAH4034734.1 unnamed protein product [Pieris brassicae]
MCGRTGLSLHRDQVCCACSFLEKKLNRFIKPDYLNEYNNGKEYTPSYNIAPTDVTPILISASKFKNAAQTSRIIKPMMWGIIPPWHKGDYKKHNLSTNNCRIENIKSSSLYNPIFRGGGRCIIVVEGFYEWQTSEKTKNKQPYYIYMKQHPNLKVTDQTTWSNNFNENEGWTGIKLMYIAGLYHVWRDENVVIYSYSVITMESNETLRWLHHRMPAILNNEDQINAWLDIDNVNADMALEYLKSMNILEWHPVSNMVNNSKNKSADCNKIINREKAKSSQKTLTSWFSTNKRKLSEFEEKKSKKVKF